MSDWGGLNSLSNKINLISVNILDNHDVFLG